MNAPVLKKCLGRLNLIPCFHAANLPDHVVLIIIVEMKRIHLISGPRNISTAMMYSFAQRSSCAIVDEPFYAHYLLETGVSHPGREETLQSMESSAQKVIADVIFKDYDENEVFFKNMGHHLIGIDLSFINDLTNLFLVRDPKRIIASFTKVIPDITIQDIGLKHQHEVLEHLIQQGIKPVVVDTGEVLKNPESGIRSLCEALGIHYEESMLSWTPGPRPEDGTWAKYWYGNLHQSKGLEAKVEASVEVEGRYHDLLEEAEYYYGKLKEYEII